MKVQNLVKRLMSKKNKVFIKNKLKNKAFSNIYF